MRFVRRALGLAASVGCSDRSTLWNLPDVPIEGGTFEQQAAVRDELLDVDRWIGPGRLQLQMVSFEAVEPPYSGKYVGDGVVLLDDQLEGATTIRLGTRHEVCHALDEAEDLSAEPMDVLDEIAAELLQSEVYGERSRSGRRQEAFAQTCEIAPFSTHLLTTKCPLDDGRINEIAIWLLNRVWRDFEPPSEAPLATPVVFHLPAGESLSGKPWIAGGVSATSDPEVVEVTVVDEDGFGTSWLVGRETGEVVTDREVESIQLPVMPYVMSPSPPLSGIIVPVGFDDDVILGLHRVEVSGIGSADERMLWLDDAGTWASVREGCWYGTLDSPRSTFIIEGLAWVAWYDGNHFAWARIGPSGGP